MPCNECGGHLLDGAAWPGRPPGRPWPGRRALGLIGTGGTLHVAGCTLQNLDKQAALHVFSSKNVSANLIVAQPADANREG
jgi:hypothetical protein